MIRIWRKSQQLYKRLRTPISHSIPSQLALRAIAAAAPPLNPPRGERGRARRGEDKRTDEAITAAPSARARSSLRFAFLLPAALIAMTARKNPQLRSGVAGVLCKILFMCRVEPAKTLKLKARRLEIYCQVHVVISPMHINRKIFILLIVKCDHEYFRCGGGSRVIVVGIMQGKAT